MDDPMGFANLLATLILILATFALADATIRATLAEEHRHEEKMAQLDNEAQRGPFPRPDNGDNPLSPRPDEPGTPPTQ